VRPGDVQCRCFLCGWVFYLKPSGESQPDSHTVLVAACTFRLSDIRVQTNMMIRMMCIDEQGQAGPNIASSMRPTCTLGKRSVRKMLEHTCVAPHCLKSPQNCCEHGFKHQCSLFASCKCAPFLHNILHILHWCHMPRQQYTLCKTHDWSERVEE